MRGTLDNLKDLFSFVAFDKCFGKDGLHGSGRLGLQI